MSFSAPIEPISNKTRGEAITAAVRPAGSSSAIRLHIHFTKAISALITAPRCDIQVGEGPDTGKLLLTFTQAGAFHICRQKSKAKVWITAPVPPCLTEDWVLSAAPCVYEFSKENKQCLIELPLAKWNADIKAFQP